MKRYFAAVTTAFFTSTSALFAASTGTVIAIGDEWTFSDNAFSNSSADATTLTENLANLLGGTEYVVAGNSSTPYGTMFESVLESAPFGKNVTRTTSQAGFDAGLAVADVMILFGTVGNGTANFAALDSFVANGGSVVVTLGAGFHGGNASSGGALEADAWNPFLQTYGLTAARVWGPSPGFTPIVNLPDGPSSLDDNVDRIYWGFGNEIDVFGADPNVQIISGKTAGGTSINAIGISPGAAPVPLPAGLLLLPAGLLALGALRRRKA